MKKENPNFEGIYQGISRERLHNSVQLPFTICPSCENIFWNPQMCSIRGCGTTFCEPCLLKSLENGEICKKCNQPAKYELNNYMESQILSELQFKCVNYPKCERILKYSELPFHLCPNDEIACSLKDCSWKGERFNIIEHESMCDFRRIICPNDKCKEEMRYNVLQKHLSEYCKFEEVKCENKCGFICLKMDMGDHLSANCPKQRIRCKYSECRDIIEREEYESHISGCLFQPKNLLCGHTVNLGAVEEHELKCSIYPVQCLTCGYKLIRSQLLSHNCLSLLLEKLLGLEGKVDVLEGVVGRQGKEICGLREENVRLREFVTAERAARREEMGEIPMKCPECKKVKSRRNLKECSICANIICLECLFKCAKCQCVVCKCTPTYTCQTCKKSYCNCNKNIQECAACMKIYCECTGLWGCARCKKKYCNCLYFVECAECKSKYCKCSQIKVCAKCTKCYCPCTSYMRICSECSKEYCECKEFAKCVKCVNILCSSCNKYKICSSCLKFSIAELKLFPVSVTNTASHLYSLSKVLEEGTTYWYSGNIYTTSVAKTEARDELIFAVKDNIILVRLEIYPKRVAAFKYMNVYTGNTQQLFDFESLALQCQPTIKFHFPKPVKAKFIKLQLNECANNSGMGIHQVKVFGVQI